uniref:Nuclear receptor domain-containing protein n=1 Tax=Meloidogyne floridensis TaxID=298350 RepID=A0A915P9S8_9BILA
MNTTSQTQNNNLSQFWATGQTSIPPITSPLGVSHVFYGAPSSLKESEQNNSPQQSQLFQALSSTRINSSENVEQQKHLNSLASDSSTNSVFNSASIQQNNQQIVSNNFSGVQNNNNNEISVNFRSPLSANSAPFESATTNFARHFPTNLLPSSTSNLSSVVAANFDCMGLMNFGLSSNANSSVIGHNNPSSQFTAFSPTNFNSTAATLQSNTSAALMPFAMCNIYANNGDSISGGGNNGIGINNSSFIEKPTPKINQIQFCSNNTLTNNQQNESQLQLMDLSTQTVSNNSSRTSSSVNSNDVSKNNGNDFMHPHLTTIKLEGEGQQSAFGTFNGEKIKQEIINIPKETTIPLESSHEATFSTTSERVQTQLCCQVCHLAASNGLHFGARTCAACAAFFRRSISDQKRYICKKSQRCVIRPSDIGTQGYRKICRNCRVDVQNKRNKRDYFFADTLNNAIQNKDIQQSPTTMEQQNKLQSLSRTEIDKLLGPHFNKLTELNESQSFTGEAKRGGITPILSSLCLSSHC